MVCLVARFKNSIASAAIDFHGIHVFVTVRVMSILCSNTLLGLEGLTHTLENEAELSYPVCGEGPIDNFNRARSFNGPCDTSITLYTMQACTDIGHTHAPVETAMEGPGNCGDILAGSTMLAVFYEYKAQAHMNQCSVLSSSQA